MDPIIVYVNGKRVLCTIDIADDMQASSFDEY